MKEKLPRVAIVGRMNVGKSTLFNRLSESAKSIAFDFAGVTRDIIKDTICWRDYCFELIDTGGIQLKKISVDLIAELARQKALATIEQADVVLFMCDGSVGILPEDRELARMLQKAQKRVILVINKSDTTASREHQYEFERLGFDSIILISALHGKGIADLFDALLAMLPKQAKKPEKEIVCRIAILGKPNVGKSSLLNLLVKKERSIVADIPGTTREAIKEKILFHADTFEIADTPGIRRKRGVTEPIEKIMVKSAFKAVENADIVLLLIDASQGVMVDQELKLAFYIFNEVYKGLIILFNKDDLVDDQTRADLAYNLEPYDYFLDKVVQIRTSCVSKKNIGKVVNVVNQVCQRYRQRFSDEELTLLFKEALQKKPLYKSEQMIRLYKARQIRNAPITIELVVNIPQFLGPSQLMYFERILRKKAELRGVPVKFLTSKR